MPVCLMTCHMNDNISKHYSTTFLVWHQSMTTDDWTLTLGLGYFWINTPACEWNKKFNST